MSDVVIVEAKRTPVGSLGGSLSSLTAPQLGASVIYEVIKSSGIKPDDVQEVVMGNVLTAGIGQAPARQAAMKAGLSERTPATTINKVCASGTKAIMIAADQIALGQNEIMVAGGMESMSNAPYLLDKARFGYRMGDGKLVDSMIKDGLWDVYNDFHMGNAAEMCASECNLSREEQDAYAKLSYERAIAAQKAGHFDAEIVDVTIKGRKGDTVVSSDEEPPRVKFDKIPNLRPVFDKEGTITAANASTINDGASAVVVTSSEFAEKNSLKPMAKIVGYASAAKAPEWFTTAPIDAIQNVMDKTGLSTNDIDLFEINEAFAVVTMAANQQLKLDIEKVNISGGAVAIGHPIGASGARILTTLLFNLKRTGGKLGLATLCIGGGEAVAVIVERI